MCRRPGLAPKKQRLGSVGLGDGEGMGEEEGPIRTRCEKGERPQGSQTPNKSEPLREAASKNERDREKIKIVPTHPPWLKNFLRLPIAGGFIYYLTLRELTIRLSGKSQCIFA